MKIIFFGPVRNDWTHVQRLIGSIRKMCFCLPWEIHLADDASQKDQLAGAWPISKQPGVRVIFNSEHQGIVGCLNQLVKSIPDGIAVPISADMEICSRFYLWILHYAISVKRVDFVFCKCRHLNSETGRITGTTGWAVRKGVQPGSGSVDQYVQGKTRPSGYAVAYRSSVLKKYCFDPILGPMCDTYLNNFMVLKYPSYYWGKVGVTTLERPGSFSKKLNRAEHEQILARIMSKLETDGIRLNEEQRRQLLETERSAFSS